MSHSTVGRYDVDSEVLRRYKVGANQVEPALCCPATDYDSQFLSVLPKEIMEKESKFKDGNGKWVVYVPNVKIIGKWQ